MLKKLRAPVGAFLFAALILSSCSNSDDESTNAATLNSADQMIQQIGEAVVSIDESSGNASGSIVRMNNYTGNHTEATCSSVGFGACGAIASGTVVKNFGGCTLAGGLLSLNGTVTLTFVGTGSTSCTMPANNDMVMRVPNFTASLVGGGTFTASSLSASGQVLTRTGASAYTFNNTGMRRTFVTGSNQTFIDMTSQTTSDIIFTGNSRTNRSITSGTLQLTNNLNGQVCNVTPNTVTWTSASCNCPTSGTWTGSCSTGEAINVAFTSTCGSVGVSFGTTVKTLTLDRCN